MTQSVADRAIDFSIEKGLTSIFLHGGEPTVHPHVVNFAEKAKKDGFLVKMFTNGINFNRVKELDGIVDDITISYRDSSSLRYIQSEWETRLTLQILVTEADFPTLASLKRFVASAKETGMNVRVNTLNPVNQYAYDNQCVPYLEEMFLKNLLIQDILNIVWILMEKFIADLKDILKISLKNQKSKNNLRKQKSN